MKTCTYIPSWFGKVYKQHTPAIRESVHTVQAVLTDPQIVGKHLRGPTS